MRGKVVTLHTVVLLFAVTCARKFGQLHKKHPPFNRTSKIQKHVIIPGTGGTTVIQGAQYGVPAAAPSSATGQCCPQSAISCCAQSQPAQPPCCLTLEPYGSHNMTVNAPSKVVLHINVLPGTTTAAPTTAASPGTTPTGSTTVGTSIISATPTGSATAGTSSTSATPTGTGSTPTAGTGASTTATGEGGTATTPPLSSSTTASTPGFVRDNPGGGFGFRHQALVEANRLRNLHTIKLQSGRLGRLHLHDVGHRGQAHAHALRLDAALNNVAQRYAQQLANSRKPAHSDPRSRLAQGENIAVECSHKDNPLSGKVATDMWYNEVTHYKWNHPGYNPRTAHFTQLVWQGSKRVGFGRAKFYNGKGQQCYVLVARYAPRGNLKGVFLKNVVKGMYSGQHPIITKG